MAIAVNKNLESGLSCIIPDLLLFLFAGERRSGWVAKFAAPKPNDFQVR
jgi:hypothetical protein